MLPYATPPITAQLDPDEERERDTLRAPARRQQLSSPAKAGARIALSGVYKNMRRGIIALVFRCRIVGGKPGATTEAQELAWLTPNEVRERMDEAYATRLLDALQPGPAAIPAYDGLSLLPA
jgi:8-oxo-dGTP diphosphatase